MSIDFSADSAFPAYRSGSIPAGDTGLAVILPGGDILFTVACPTGETVYVSAVTPWDATQAYPIAYSSGTGTDERPASYSSTRSTLYLYERTGALPTIYVAVTVPTVSA